MYGFVSYNVQHMLYLILICVNTAFKYYWIKHVTFDFTS